MTTTATDESRAQSGRRWEKLHWLPSLAATVAVSAALVFLIELIVRGSFSQTLAFFQQPFRPGWTTVALFSLLLIGCDALLGRRHNGLLLVGPLALLLAAIILNGQPQNRISPARFDSITPGNYEVQLRHFGYQDWKSTIQIEHAQTQQIRAEMVPLPEPEKPKAPPTATSADIPFLISAEPPSEIVVDGVSQGRPLDGRVQILVKPGNHRVQFRLEAYAPVTREVIVNAEADNRLEFKWFGSIRVQAFDEKGDPVFGAVFLDSMRTKHLSDGSEWPVPVGEYAVIVKKTGYVMRDVPPRINVRGGDQPRVPPIVLQKRMEAK